MNKMGKGLGVIFLCTIGILLIPFFAMQFNDAVNWSAMDFTVMGSMLLFTGFVVILILQKTSLKYRIPLVLATILILLLVWVELAVGVFGTPWAGS
jgi:uncharacterized membrane protein YoaT (DUF817 family)